MIRTTISHEYLRKVIEEVESQEDPSIESINTLVEEIKHSNLILAANFLSDGINCPSVSINDEDFGLLFTDMSEFNKVFSKNEFEAHENVFEFHRKLLDLTNLKGYVINIESECFVIWDDLIDKFGVMPKFNFSSDDTYTTSELKQLKDSINNGDLENFVENPKNIGRYEELFDKISGSTMFVLRLTRDEFNCENGILNLKERGPVGFLYKNDYYGNYAPVYTSEAKMVNVNTHLNKYSQLINFSQIANSVLAGDMDGIIINPDTDNVILTRDVLLEFSPIIDEICNNSKLNSGIFHIFSIEEV